MTQFPKWQYIYILIAAAEVLAGSALIYVHRADLVSILAILVLLGLALYTLKLSASMKQSMVRDLRLVEGESRAQVQFVLDSMVLGIWKFYPQTNALEWDDNMYRIYDVSPENFSGAYDAWENSLSPEAKEQAVKELQLALSGEKDFNTVFPITRKNGEIRYIGGRGVVHRDENGQPIQMVGVNWDVTAIKNIENQLQSNQELWNFAIEGAGIAIWDWDIETSKVVYSKQWKTMLGLGPDATIGSIGDWKTRIHPDDAPWVDIVLQAHLNGAVPHNNEHRLLRNDGIYVWTMCRWMVVKDPKNQQPKRVICVQIDISERKRIEEQIFKTSNELNRFFNGTSGLLCVSNKQGKFIKLNPAFAELLGYPLDQLYTGTMKDYVHPDDWDVTNHKLNEGQSHESVHFINRYRCSNGDFKFLNWSASIDSEIGLLYAVAQDITDFKIAEMKLIQTSKLASLGELSAGIGHELNNPLAIILGTLEILPKMIDHPEKFVEKINAVRRAAERISLIVGGMKKFSRNSAGSKFVPLPLSKIAQEALTLTEIKWKHSSTPVKCEVKSNAMILCNEIEIEQVLVNLINNAVDAVKDMEKRWVVLTVFEDAADVVLWVTDSGPGISEDVQRKLFDPFFTTKEVGQGTGLGLSISKGIVEAHNGSIKVLAKTPNTCFELRFKKVLQ